MKEDLLNTLQILGRLASIIQRGFVLKVSYDKANHPKWTATLEKSSPRARYITHSDYGPIRALEGLVDKAIPRNEKDNVLRLRPLPNRSKN